MLTQEDRDKFHCLHQRYVHLFTPQPGRYNGKWGYIDNKLKFSTPPPPNSRTHIPNYSPAMNKLLAEKMDLLEKWGVLSTPEQAGVEVEFVSPSMLVPKSDSKDYRLVTDFAALNIYLKRVPNTSASIAQAKSRIAKAKYVVHLDLSNYFFQCGLQHQDIKFLGTVHPFKGLRVYTCDPQGLKGASERSYEKLLRIFGDMIQNGHLAQMADGLHVLGDSVEQLANNYEQVLMRADLCNLTFKPSKVIVCPRDISLFGWDLKGQKWYPTAHTTSTLVNAQLPVTVKQLRSFLGSFKQLSASLPNYASTIHILEQTAAGKKSAERINWTTNLKDAFEAAKTLAANPIGIAEPRPDDQLQTYSDFSAESRAVGGRMVILRKQQDGSTAELPGGFFNVILDKHKKNWLPCEGEAAGIRLVLEHYKHHIRESKNLTIHFTDSQPCVLAWRRSQKGAFSASSRISSFLTGLSAMPIELRHRAGKLMHTSDFASRHPTSCTSNKCQICNFVREWESIGDKASEIRNVTIEDIKMGRSIMPMTQRNTWKNIQKRDAIHHKLVDLINTRQLPEARKTRGDHTKLKLLHNQYTQGKLFIDNDGLVLIKSPEGKFNGSVISIPPALFPGVANALHIQLDHPGKAQLSGLVSRYFYTPGWKSIIDEISDNCHQCAAVRKLPKVLLQDSTSLTTALASNFSADVIERSSQKILIVRENLSQFTRGAIVEDQSCNSLRNALLPLIINLVPESGAEIRVDGATSFQALQKESETPGTILNRLKIKIIIGRLLNKNKNPTAENANQEILKEILRHTNDSGPVSQTQLTMILKNVNSRVRSNGLTPKEILLRREYTNNKPIDVNDDFLSRKQLENRKLSAESSRKNKAKNHSPSPAQSFSIGDLVFLREVHNKNSPRELYIIEDREDGYFLIRKLKQRLRSKLYRALPDEMIPAPSTPPTTINPPITEEPLPLNTPTEDPNKPSDTIPTHTKAGRPLRKAARKAHGFNTLATSLMPKHTMKFGWISEDQESDDDYFLPPVSSFYQSTHTPENSPSSTTRHTSTSSPEDSSIESNSSDSDTELLWDSSPEQLQLSNEHNPPTEITPPCYRPHLPTTSRRFATSEKSLTRSDAFKTPPDPNRLHVCSRKSHIPQIQAPEGPRKRTRIPRPQTPTSLNLHAVANVEDLLPHTPPRRPVATAPFQNIPEPYSTLPQNAARNRQLRERRPFNYMVFHRTGRRQLPTNEDNNHELDTEESNVHDNDVQEEEPHGEDDTEKNKGDKQPREPRPGIQ